MTLNWLKRLKPIKKEEYHDSNRKKDNMIVKGRLLTRVNGISTYRAVLPITNTNFDIWGNK